MSTVKVTIDSYAILGVARDASVKDINLAYKRLALKLHPDKAGNDNAAIERFQKIQDAIELLRDPLRRNELDMSLNSKSKRHRSRYPDDNWSNCATEADSERSSKQERHGFDFKSTQSASWGAQDAQGYSDRNQKRAFNDVFSGKFDQQSKRQRHQQPSLYGYGGQYSYSRYMYSYGNSVHMDPNSADSKARKAQFKADNAQWEREWAGIDTNVEKARAEAREETCKRSMQDRVACEAREQQKRKAEDEGHKLREDLRKAEEDLRRVMLRVTEELQRQSKKTMNEAVNCMKKAKENIPSPLPTVTSGVKFEAYLGKHCKIVHEYPKQDIKSRKPSDTFNNFASERAREPESKKPKSTKFNNDKADPIYSSGTFSPESLVTDTSNSSSARSASSRASSNPCASSTSANPSWAKVAPNDQASTNDHLAFQYAADRLIGAHMVGHESTLKPLIPLFKQKLADPSGRYTIDDLASELNGVMLETYNGWLESVRLTMPNATPITVRNKPEACSHLGAWEKKYSHPKCDTCNFWMPLFVLTCPGCGLKACIRCKFTGDAFVLDRH